MVIETFHFDTHCEAKLTLFHKYGFVLWSLTNIFIVASDKQDVKKPYDQDVIITEKQDDIKPVIQDLQDSALQDSSQEPNQFEVILEVAILVSNQPIFWYHSSVIILHVFTLYGSHLYAASKSTKCTSKLFNFFTKWGWNNWVRCSWCIICNISERKDSYQIHLGICMSLNLFT